MKTNNRFERLAILAIAVVLVAVGVSAFAAGCDSADTVQQDQAVSQESQAGDVQAAYTDMTEDEQLVYLREEEKLARDVYLALYEEWGIEEFSTIADSETRHMESVKNLLDRYGLEDPVGDDIPGVFVNAELQSAYEELVALGSQSVDDAYQVGITIEEMDIEDLQVLIASTDSRDITRVAENLLKGSQNHLAAFTRLAGE